MAQGWKSGDLKVSINEVSPEQFARLFHRYHAALAEENGSQDASLRRWQELPNSERECMVAAARLTLLELEVFPPKEPAEEENDRRRWFAKPGEAEWGC
jgi:hypothetical protein